MKRISLSVLVLLLAGIQPLLAQVQGQWAATGAMVSARELNAQVRLNTGSVLSIGGVDNSNNILASAETYSPSSGKWTLTGSMAEARESFPAVVLNGGKVLVAGGVTTGSVVLSTAEIYDPATGTWSSAGSMAVARVGHSATLLPSGDVLVTGGCSDILCSSITANSELYNPATNTWSETGSLNTARYDQTAVLLKTGKLMVIGGSTGSATTSCELYDPATGVWSPTASMNIARYLDTTTLLADGKVLAAGGYAGRGGYTSAELYDPIADTWTPTGNMTIDRYDQAAALLTDGTVLVAGGIGQSISCGKDCTGYVPTNKADIYNETLGVFTPAAAMSQSLASQSMTLLASGRPLENGGSGTTATCCIVESTASIYTPLTLTFSSASLNFGLLQIGLSSPPQTVTVTNVTTHAVTFSSIASSGDYSQTNTCPATLNAGQNCTITATFTPSASGTRRGAITLKDNSAGSPLQTIALTGAGETLALGFTPAALNFGSITPGTSLAMSAALTNDGAAPVSITKIAITPANGTYTQTNTCPASLAVQQPCTVTITFTPPDVFTYTATLSVSNSAGANATLALKGAGLNN